MLQNQDNVRPKIIASKRECWKSQSKKERAEKCQNNIQKFQGNLQETNYVKKQNKFAVIKFDFLFIIKFLYFFIE